jgi:trk system potassium uptake protein TrkH
MIIFMQAVNRRIKQIQHPRAIVPVRINGRKINDDMVSAGVLYVVVYLGAVFISTLILAALGVDGLTAFSGSAATMGNVGPGLGMVGSAGNFNNIPTLGKWILTFTMLLGRLEIYGLIIFFNPKIWK